jgi:hypothetical protein
MEERETWSSAVTSVQKEVDQAASIAHALQRDKDDLSIHLNTMTAKVHNLNRNLETVSCPFDSLRLLLIANYNS